VTINRLPGLILLSLVGIAATLIVAEAQLPQLTCCSSGSSSGGLSQGAGTTITDELLVRGDVSGLQGSTLSLTDAGLLRFNGASGSYPALKAASNGNLFVRLADDAGPANVSLLGLISASDVRVGGLNTTTGASGNSVIFLKADAAAGYVAIYGSGGSPCVKFTGTANAENGLDVGVCRSSAGRVKISNGSSGVGALLGSKGTDVVSANDVTLGNANFFTVTGNTQLNTIAATDWTAGSVIVLQFSGAPTVKHNTAGTGASLLLAGAADFAATANDTLTLVYNGTAWVETARATI